MIKEDSTSTVAGNKTAKPFNASSIHLPGLNGLRAIAAMSVVLGHVTMRVNPGGAENFDFPYIIHVPFGGYGVTLFFVISGFLITYLLIKEREISNHISVRKFYARRILRIWPLYYAFITLCFIVLSIFHEPASMGVKQMWYYIFFAANYPFILGTGIIIIAHYWSIGVEEQFYLFWPWVVRISKNRLVRTSLIIFIVLFVVKTVFWILYGPHSFLYRLLNVTRFHCMMVGAIGAILYAKKNIYFEKIFCNRVTETICWAIFFIVGLGIIRLPAVVGQEVIAVVSLGMIIGQVALTRTIINLENKIFDLIGKISYGLYVIHPIVIYLMSKLFLHISVSVGIRYVLVYTSVVFFTIAISWISYTYFEKPFLKLKHKFAIVKSAASMKSGI